MSAPSKNAVTPQRVADGDPGALTRLIERRARAVIAYCETVCTYDVAPRAAAEAFARFRAAVHAAEDPRALDPESLLHSATRHAAGALARSANSDRRRGRGRNWRGDDQLRCIPTPILLAARADHMLGVAEDERLTEHLRRCAGCRAVEARFVRAEEAYKRRSSDDIDPHTVQELLEALYHAAPIADKYIKDWAGVLPESASDVPIADPAQPELPHASETPSEPNDEAGPEYHDEYEYEPEDGDGVGDELTNEPEPEPDDEYEPVGEPLAYEMAEPAAEPTGNLPAPDHSRTADPALTPMRRFKAPARPTLPVRPAVLAGALTRARGQELPRPFRNSTHHVLDRQFTDHGPIYRFVLPGTALFVAALIILAVAGVFSAGGA